MEAFKRSGFMVILAGLLVTAGILTTEVFILDFAQHIDSSTPVTKKITEPKTTYPNGNPESPDDILKVVNQYRTVNQLPVLNESQYLEGAAYDHCNDMITYNYYGHSNPKTGADYLTFINKYLNTSKPGASFGENIQEFPVAGPLSNSSAKQVVTNWYNDASHRANLLSDKYQITGYATCPNTANNSVIYVQMFAGAPQ